MKIISLYVGLSPCLYLMILLFNAFVSTVYKFPDPIRIKCFRFGLKSF